MAYTTLNSLLTAIADAIRLKKGTTAQINAQNFPSEIASITAEVSSKIIGKNTNYKVTGRSGSSINISSECSVPNARIAMIIAGGVGINDSGSQIGTTTVKAITTAGTEYTCQYSNGYYKVPTDTTYKKVVVYHNNYGGSEMSHGVIIPIIVFGY